MEKMKVLGFVGPSGTGKSYRVTELAGTHGIPLIIDDGLLIRGSTAIAGISAKGEKTKYASVKRALFFDAAHAKAVQDAIRQEGADSILLVGTSEQMVEKIAAALSLPTPQKIIRIQDVSTKEEMETAKHIRKTEGKHVIPVPTLQIRKDFSGYWLDPLQLFRPAVKEPETEKTLIRPTYSYMGDFTISHSVLVTLCAYEVKSFPEVTRVWICSAEERGKNLVVHLELNFAYGTPVHTVGEAIRTRIMENVMEFTGIYVEDVRLTVRSLDF